MSTLTTTAKAGLLDIIRQSLAELSRADLIVIEGAGSAAEVQLSQAIVNMGLAQLVKPGHLDR